MRQQSVWNWAFRGLPSPHLLLAWACCSGSPPKQGPTTTTWQPETIASLPGKMDHFRCIPLQNNKHSLWSGEAHTHKGRRFRLFIVTPADLQVSSHSPTLGISLVGASLKRRRQTGTLSGKANRACLCCCRFSFLLTHISFGTVLQFYAELPLYLLLSD